ncbi:YjbF family lipoprotein [Pacificoceanicola onchidii]|uniref:YjbF family lipoprotein n=1 Tax=Pacificoceanicola onchidii TaxID=2562685 RepID=UPI0010A6340C|nr:YjbF family lipoprotein [Pacificoceanicola onchidii]
MMRLVLSLLCLSILSACSSSGSELNALRGTLSGIMGQRAAPPNLRQSLTPEAIANFNGPLMFVEVTGNGIQAGLTPGVRNGAVQQWITQDAASLSFLGGIVTASRGLGGDLITADVRDVAAAVQGRADHAERVHRYLTHENSLEIRAFKCSYVQAGPDSADTLAGRFPARRVEETCYDSKGLKVENQYWIDRSGVVRRSVQWISPFVGYVDIHRLKDR